jgi:hypothetical protein
VVGVTVADEDCEQARVRLLEAGGGRQRGALVIEREAEVEQQAGPVSFELDTTAADLACAAMDTPPHAIGIGIPASYSNGGLRGDDFKDALANGGATRDARPL